MANRREIRVEGLNEPISHYTDAVQFGDLLFISGCGPVDGDFNLVGGGDVAEQARQVFRNMEQVLTAAGASIADILRVTVYLTDVDDRQKINPIREEYFGHNRPASTLIGVKALAIPGMKVEVDAIAGMPSA
ncbi:MAG: RidA family protein [Acidimicrobiia bacterium]